jgi:hypothetical protein
MRRVDNLMEILRQLLIKLGVNAIPLGGFLFGGWSGATALAIYWFENLIGSLLIASRIAIHRRLTHKRGHWSAQLGVSVTAGTGATPKEPAFGSFLTEFLTTSLAFTFVHGLFLGAVLVVIVIVHALPDPAGFRAGALGVTAFLLFDFAIDLIKLK